MKNKITITHEQLTERGYEQKKWVGKLSPNDELYNLKFVEFKKAIRDDSKVSICYSYHHAISGPPNLFETTCELSIGSEYLLLQITTINDLDQLTRLIEK